MPMAADFGTKIWNTKFSGRENELQIESSLSNVLALAKRGPYVTIFPNPLIVVKSDYGNVINWVVAEFSFKELLAEMLSTMKRSDKSDTIITDTHFKYFLESTNQEYRAITWIAPKRDGSGRTVYIPEPANPQLRLKHMAVTELMLLESIYAKEKFDEACADAMERMPDLFRN